MLKEMISTSQQVLALGIRQHGRILAGRDKEIAKIFTTSKWTCHCCGIQVPDFMELDHISAHSQSCKNLRVICTFCHNIKHPLWAAARGRLIPVLAPDMSQEDVTRLAWMVTAWRDHETVRIEHVMRGMEQRAQAFISLTGVDRAEPFLEAVMAYGLTLKRDKSIQPMSDALAELDKCVRFWPAEATRDRDELPAAACLSIWTVGGFKKAGRSAGEALRSSVRPDFEKLGIAAAKVMEKS